MLQKYHLKYHQNPGPPWSARVACDAPPNPLVEFAELHAHLPLRGGTNPLTCAPPAIFQAPPSAIPTLRGNIQPHITNSPGLPYSIYVTVKV